MTKHRTQPLSFILSGLLGIALLLNPAGAQPAPDAPVRLTVEEDLQDPKFLAALLGKARNKKDLHLRVRDSLLMDFDSGTPYSGWVSESRGDGLALGQYKSGKPEGYLFMWDSKGQIRSWSQNIDGKKQGLWVLWREDGKKEEEINYKNGEPHGRVTLWHTNGHKMSEGFYEEGQKVGVHTEWHRNGNKKLEMKLGQNDSFVRTEWDENGKEASRVKVEEANSATPRKFIWNGRKFVRDLEEEIDQLVELPVDARNQSLKQSTGNLAKINIRKSGAYVILGKQVIEEQIKVWLTGELKKKPDLKVLIRADREAKHLFLANVISICRKVGVPRASIAVKTERSSKSDGNSKPEPEALVQNPEPEAPQKKLTPEEVEALLADEIGTWQVKGHTLQQGIDVETGLAWKPKDSKFTMETRWKEKGKSTSSTFSPVINGKKVPYVATWEYDAKEGVFIWRSKGEGFPEAVENQRYDPEKKIFHGVTLHPNGAIETTTFKIVNQDKRLFSSHVRVDGRIVFSREEVFTRLEEKPEDHALAEFIQNKAIHVEMNDQKVWFRFKNDGSVSIEDESGDTIPMNYMVRGLRVTFSKGSEEMVFTFQKPKVSAGDKLILTIGTSSEGGEARVIEVIATRKLTKGEVADLFSGDIGKWKLTGKRVSEGGTPEPFENIIETNWKVEGQSTLARSKLSINGKKVPFTWNKEYNAKEGVFISRSKGEGFPETVFRERFDPEKKIYHGQGTYPNGAKETYTFEIINKDKRIFKMQVEAEGRVVYSMEAVSKRMDENHPPKPIRPKPAAPNSGKIESPEVLAKRTLDALSKNDYPALTQLGLESLPKEALIEIMVSIRYPLTDEYIKETAQRRGITKEQAEADIKDKILKGRTRMAEGYQEGIKQISAKRKASFEKVISVGKKQAKIEWSKVSFVRLEGKAYERGGVRGGDYFIIFAYNGSQFKIKLDDCTYHPRHGWFIQHGPDWDETTEDGHATAEEGSSHEEPAPTKPTSNALKKGLVAYYPFNGNAKDEAGNGHDGTVVGAKLTKDRHGKPDSAYQFKLGDHIKIDGLMGKPKNLTLAAWVKLDGQQGRWGSEIISMGGYATLRMDNRQSVKNSGTGGLIFSGRTGRSYWVHVMKKAKYTGTGWHQVVFTVDDNADKQVTYVDGQKVAAKQNPKSIVYKGFGRNTFFGIHGYSTTTNFMSQGVIDDIRVYDRALNTDEVKVLFLSEKPATPLQAGKKIKAGTETEKTNEALTSSGDLLKGTKWKYDDSGRDPGTEWRGIEFDDAEWDSGPAPLGYGDDDIATGIGFGPDEENKHITSYFRTGFEVPEDRVDSSLRMSLRCDDGAIIYLNGKEVIRYNLPGGNVRHSQSALRIISGNQEKTFRNYNIAATTLRTGNNVLAAEVHQRGRTSSDLIFDLKVFQTGETVPAPATLAKAITGKRIVCQIDKDQEQPEHSNVLLQFEKDGIFNIAEISEGKISPKDDDLTYTVDGLTARVKKNGEEDGGVTFTSTTPKKGDKISFGREKRQITATILRIEPAAPLVNTPPKQSKIGLGQMLLELQQPLTDQEKLLVGRWQEFDMEEPDTPLSHIFRPDRSYTWFIVHPATDDEGNEIAGKTEGHLYHGIWKIDDNRLNHFDLVYNGEKLEEVVTWISELKSLTRDGYRSEETVEGDTTKFRGLPVEKFTAPEMLPYNDATAFQSFDIRKTYNSATGKGTEQINIFFSSTPKTSKPINPEPAEDPTKPEPKTEAKKPGTVLWEFKTGGIVLSSPAIGSDGTVYVGSGHPDNKLYAINGKSGVKLWEFQTRHRVRSSPAIGSDGTVYVGSDDGKLYAINGKSGVKLWEFETRAWMHSSPAIGSDGTVYVGSMDNKLYAINGKTGVKLWEFKTGSRVASSPAIGSDGTVYVGSFDRKLYAINGKSGLKLWEFETGDKVYSSPAIGSDGTVYVGSKDNKLYAINSRSGLKLWEFETGYSVVSSPAIGSDGTVYIGSWDKKLYAINGKSGVKLWEFETGSNVTSSPAIGSDGTVYVGSWDKKLYAINGKSGVTLWEFETGGDVDSCPAIGPDGTVYVGSKDNKLYAIKTESKGLAKSPWPMRGQNAQHTGQVTNKATEPTEPKDFPKEIKGNTLTLQEDDPEVVFKRKVSTKHPAELAHVWVPGPFAGTDQVLILSKEGKLTINPRKGLTTKGTWGVPQGVAGNQVILTFDHPETGREHVLKYEYMLGEQEIQDLSGKTTGKEVVLYLKGIGNNKDETEYVRPVK